MSKKVYCIAQFLPKAGQEQALFVDLFLDAHAKAPAQITLDLDATDDPLHAESPHALPGR